MPFFFLAFSFWHVWVLLSPRTQVRALVQKLDNILTEQLPPKRVRPRLTVASDSHAAITSSDRRRKMSVDGVTPWDDADADADLSSGLHNMDMLVATVRDLECAM